MGHKRFANKVAKRLERAADQIEFRGWTRGQDLDPKTGRVCADGALRIAAGGAPVLKFADGDGLGPMTDSHLYRESLYAVAEMLHKENLRVGLLAPEVAVESYNDSQRDRRKVTRALRRAARMVRSGRIPVLPPINF